MNTDLRYAIFLNKVEGKELTKDLILRHVEHLAKLDREGRLVICGPFTDHPSGMVVIQAKDKSEAEAVAASDPFVREGARTYDVRTWSIACRENNFLAGDRDTPQVKLVYICSSFKDLETTRAVARQFGESGLKAVYSEPGDPDGVDGCLKRIDQADIVYVSNPRGEIGKSVAMDIGYALAKRKPVFSSQPISDPPIAHHVRSQPITHATEWPGKIL